MFGKEAYVDLLEEFKAKRAEFSTDWSGRLHPDHLLLRHDIDFSVEHAHEIALVERDHDVVATYFFMLTSNTYNLLSRRSASLVKGIRALGHKISLHFDPTAYPSMEGFRNEKNIFEQMFEVELDIVSIHRPGIFLENNNADLLGCKQTYQDRYFRDMKYISDSGGRDISQPVRDYFSQPGGAARTTTPPRRCSA